MLFAIIPFVFAGGGGLGNEVIGLGFEYEAEEGEVMGLFFYLIK